jgi:hypothetical protein
MNNVWLVAQAQHKHTTGRLPVGNAGIRTFAVCAKGFTVI